MTTVRVSDAIREAALGPRLELDEALDKYYAPGFTHRSDGVTQDRAAFAAMVGRLRDRIVGGTVTVLDEMVDGSRYAERHVYEATLVDGTTVKREIYVFGEFAEDGRFRSVTEAGFDA